MKAARACSPDHEGCSCFRKCVVNWGCLHGQDRAEADLARLHALAIPLGVRPRLLLGLGPGAARARRRRHVGPAASPPRCARPAVFPGERRHCLEFLAGVVRCDRPASRKPRFHCRGREQRTPWHSGIYHVHSLLCDVSSQGRAAGYLSDALPNDASPPQSCEAGVLTCAPCAPRPMRRRLPRRGGLRCRRPCAPPDCAVTPRRFWQAWAPLEKATQHGKRPRKPLPATPGRMPSPPPIPRRPAPPRPPPPPPAAHRQPHPHRPPALLRSRRARARAQAPPAPPARSHPCAVPDARRARAPRPPGGRVGMP